MIDKSALTAVLERGMEGTDLFLVDVRISKDNNIVVEIDSDTSVDIDECIRLNRLVESEFDRDEEDYELEIGSAGLTSPLRVERQYHKNEGNEVEVLTADGRKLKGILNALFFDVRLGCLFRYRGSCRSFCGLNKLKTCSRCLFLKEISYLYAV